LPGTGDSGGSTPPLGTEPSTRLSSRASDAAAPVNAAEAICLAVVTNLGSGGDMGNGQGGEAELAGTVGPATSPSPPRPSEPSLDDFPSRSVFFPSRFMSVERREHHDVGADADYAKRDRRLTYPVTLLATTILDALSDRAGRRRAQRCPGHRRCCGAPCPRDEIAR
jgi:hypothetical protein